MEENPMVSVYGVFRRINGGNWVHHSTYARKPTFYSRKSTAKSVASQANGDGMNNRHRRDNTNTYEYKVMKLEGEWEDV